MKNLLLASTLTVMSAVSAHAASVTNLGSGQAAYDQVNTSAGTALTPNLSFDANIRTGSIGVSRSPYDFSGSAGVTGFEQLSYFSIGPNNVPSPATLTITGGANTLEFLWGSIDTYNAVELYSGATLLDTIEFTTSAAVNAFTPEGGGVGASFVSIFSDAQFDSAVFVSGTNAFELANISVSAVPLPAGFVLLMTALGGLGVASRRRKSA